MARAPVGEAQPRLARAVQEPVLRRRPLTAPDRHGGHQIYLGETAPLGSRAKSRKAPMGPATFLNALFRGGKRFPVTGYGTTRTRR